MTGRRVAAVVVVVAALAVTTGAGVLAFGLPRATVEPVPGLAASTSATPSIARPAAVASAATTASVPVPTTRAAGATTTQPPAATPAPNPTPLAAPTSGVKFDPRRTVVPILFPLPPTARYTYAAFWRAPRDGVVYPYNQIRGVTPKGVLLRAHDGVDLQVKIGTNVLAPFAGAVVDPAKIWKPWDPARYGNVVVIRSTESTSTGYYAILVHLSKKNVSIGQTVRRGQLVGRTGISGNAAETIPHLHFELRTPFPIEFQYAGVKRVLDSFDPLPSLHAADPHRR